MSENKKEVEVKFADKEKATIKIYVEKPNNDVVKRADRCKAKAWNECIMDGIVTKKELSTLMKQRGIWSEVKEDEQEAITKEINRLEQQLYLECGKRESKKEEGKTLAIDIRRKRNELRDLIGEKMSLEENTAEALADNSRFDFLVAHCTYHKNGQRVYKDMEDYNSKSADEIAFAAASELATIMYAIDSDFEKNLPENKWLKNRELVNDDLALVNKDGKRVDLEGRVIDENGYYLDDKGNRVDKQGHPLSEDGFYEEVDDEDQPKPTKPTRKRATRKKTTDS
jgi:hypothetical protein